MASGSYSMPSWSSVNVTRHTWNNGHSNTANTIARAVNNQLAALPAVRTDLISVQQPAHLVLFSAGNQLLQGVRGKTIEGDPGTVISRHKEVVILHAGNLKINSGSSPTTVQTRLATVTVNPDSKVVINDQSESAMRVTVIESRGDAGTIIANAGGVGAPLTFKAGEEVILADEKIDIDNLIPTDGLTPIIVSGGIVKKPEITKTQVAAARPPLAGKKKLPMRAMRVSTLSELTPVSFVSGAPNLAMNGWTKTEQSVKQAGDTQATATAPVQIVALPGAQFSHSSVNNLKLSSGAVFLPAKADTTIDMPLVQVKVRKNAIAMVEANKTSCRIKALSGPDEVEVQAGDETVSVGPGEEIIISDHQLTRAEAHPVDGIARRIRQAKQLNNSLHLARNDFSMVSLMNFPGNLAMMKQIDDKGKLVDKLVKTAVVVEMVTKSHGKYSFAAQDEQVKLSRALP